MNCVTNDCIKSIHQASKCRHQSWNLVQSYIQPGETTGWHRKKVSHFPPASSLTSEVATMWPQHQLAQWPAWQKTDLPKQSFLSDRVVELTHSVLTDCSTQYNMSWWNRWDGGSVGLPLLNTASTQTTSCAEPSHMLRYLQGLGVQQVMLCNYLITELFPEESTIFLLQPWLRRLQSNSW